MITTFNSSRPGLNLIIMAGVHGDEVCGLEAFTRYIPNFQPLNGCVTFIIGSPKAVVANKREFKTNLNRMFRPDTELSQQELLSYEYQRSRELMSILAKADALLDIHSSTTKQTVPFVICESQSFDCVAHLPVEKVVSGIDILHPTGTDAFVNMSGGKGICIECGNHNDAQSVDVALEAIESFLGYFGVINKPKTQLKNQSYIKADTIYKNINEFVLAREFKEFEKVSKGDVIGIDGTQSILAPYNGVILFPNNRKKTNQEAFLFGVEEAVR